MSMTTKYEYHYHFLIPNLYLLLKCIWFCW